MTSGSGVMVLNNEVRAGVTEKVTFGRDLKFMRMQSFQMLMWRPAGHGQGREGMSWAISWRSCQSLLRAWLSLWDRDYGNYHK